MAYTTPLKVFREMQRLEEAEETFDNVSSGDTLELTNKHIVENAYSSDSKTAIVTVGGNVQASSDYTVDFEQSEIDYSGNDSGSATVRYYFAPLPTPTVKDIISNVEDDIDEATNTTYDGVNTVTDEIYDGTHRSTPRYVFANRPVQSVEVVELNQPDPGGPNPNYVTVDEGLGSDYVEWQDFGVRFLEDGQRPSNDPEDVRVTYTYGYIDVPGRVERLATIKTIDAIARNAVEGAIVDGRDNFDPQTVDTYSREIRDLESELRIEKMANFTDLAVKGSES